MRPRWLVVAGFLVVLAFSARYLTAQTLPMPSAVSTRVSSSGSGPPSLFPNGTQAAPSIAFAADPSMGFYRAGQGITVLTNGNINRFWYSATQLVVGNATNFAWTSVGDAGNTPDSGIGRAAASVTQSSAITGGGFLGAGATAAFALTRLIATGSSPNCIDNCGSAGAAVVVGTDGAWRITLGTADAKSSFAIGFRIAFTGAPNCVVQLAGTGLASVASTNTNATGVTVNLTTAPSNGQVYHGQCIGLTLG